jgi:putative transposase
MTRTARASQANYCYHVLNRGNARAQVFHKPADYDAFVELLELACRKRPMRVLGYCLMPNHFHLVLWPSGDGNLGTWMQWLMTSHVRRHHRHYHSSGHVWQGRFKAFPIEEDEHLRVVLRYVERNPLRAGLVERAEDWRWSSLSPPPATLPAWIDPGPAPRGKGWVEEVNQIAANDDAIIRLRKCVERGTPFGSESWSSRTVATLGLESSVRPRGRPRKILATN